jgi:hypothetical protein
MAPSAIWYESYSSVSAARRVQRPDSPLERVFRADGQGNSTLSSASALWEDPMEIPPPRDLIPCATSDAACVADTMTSLDRATEAHRLSGGSRRAIA